MEEEAWTTYGAPQTLWFDVRFNTTATGGSLTLDVDLLLFNKTATRLQVRRGRGGGGGCMVRFGGDCAWCDSGVIGGGDG